MLRREPLISFDSTRGKVEILWSTITILILQVGVNTLWIDVFGVGPLSSILFESFWLKRRCQEMIRVFSISVLIRIDMFLVLASAMQVVLLVGSRSRSNLSMSKVFWTIFNVGVGPSLNFQNQAAPNLLSLSWAWTWKKVGKILLFYKMSLRS